MRLTLLCRWPALLVAFGLLGAAGCNGTAPPPSAKLGTSAATSPKSPAPMADGQTTVGRVDVHPAKLAGIDETIRGLKGKVVYVDFWGWT
jgi:hypothetical protein